MHWWRADGLLFSGAYSRIGWYASVADWLTEFGLYRNVAFYIGIYGFNSRHYKRWVL